MTRNTLLWKFDPKIKIVSLRWNSALIWICRIMLKICGVHFFCFRPEKSFWVNLVKKIKIVSLSWNLLPRLIWISRINDDVHFFCFCAYLSWANLVQNSKLFKVKFDTKTNSNMQNSMLMYNLSVLDWK